jgi:hypothetical protein
MPEEACSKTLPTIKYISKKILHKPGASSCRLGKREAGAPLWFSDTAYDFTSPFQGCASSYFYSSGVAPDVII